MSEDTRSVLVVGGGLVGLSAALFLAQHRVATVLVERHRGGSSHPRAAGFPQRTMELFRAVGLGDTVPQIPADSQLVRARVHSLAGEWFERSSFTPSKEGTPVIAYSPCTAAALAQDQLEPVLRDRAIELGADIRMSTELVGFEQDATGVSALLRQGDGDNYTFRVPYLIAADGHRSPIRESLTIGRSGRGLIQTMRSVLFRAPLDQYLEQGVTQFEIDQTDLKAFLTTYGDGRWVLMFKDDIERDGEGLKQAISRAVGRADVPVDIITTGRWEISGLIADRFAAGRVFLAGDAAHTLPPARGGYGANTGIADAHNLAWKLAAVLSGASTPALLDSYDAERRPVAWLRHQQIFARPDYKRYANGVAEHEPILDEDAIEFGQIYRSGAVLGESNALPVALRPDEWAGQPGTRAPHLWVTRGGQRLSTLDLFQSGWVLLTADDRWCIAMDAVASATGIAIECVLVGRDVRFPTDGAFEAAFGISASGASLIRPDGHVGWRADELPADPGQALTNAVATISCARRSWRITGRRSKRPLDVRALASD